MSRPQLHPQSAAELRGVLDSVFADPAYQWRSDRDPTSWLLAGWEALTDWLMRFRDANPVLYQWFILGLIAVLVVIVVHAVWTLLRTLRAPPAPRRAAPAPQARPRGAQWHAERAEEHAASGRFAEAVQQAFHALILDLDRRGVLQYQPAKTPSEYTREPKLDPTDRDRLQLLVKELYRFVFGRESCTADDYARWQSLARGSWHALAS